MDALPASEKDKYIENKMKPQIEQEIKDITFPNEAKKEELEFITNAGAQRTPARTHARTHARARAHTHTHTHGIASPDPLPATSARACRWKQQASTAAYYNI